MCGIAGYIEQGYYGSAPIRQMLGRLAHRGPDAQGVWQDNREQITFGHVRLSILDLSEAGRQPMLSESGRFVITYNGEVYNYREIRKELENIVRFRTETDTEVVLAAFEAWGVGSIDKLNGMFAFAIYDRKERQLYLVRDRIGIKPLYYGWVGGEFVFSSDLAAIKCFPGFNAELNRSALKSYVRLGYIPAPHSIYTDIYKLIPGTYFRLSLQNYQKNSFSPFPSISDGRFAPFYYWNPGSRMKRALACQADFEYQHGKRELKEILKESVRTHLVSDVPLGCFLSGGIDSSLIAALMREVSTNTVKTFTIGFDDPKYNEAEYARAIARHLGTEHTELCATEKDALGVIGKIPSIYSEPFADASQLPTFLLSELTKKSVTVALSGDGGDELFAGYERYIVARNIWNVSRLLPTVVKNLARRLLNHIPEQFYPFMLKPFTYLVPRIFQERAPGSLYQSGINVGLSSTRSELYLNQVSQQYSPERLVISEEPEPLFLPEGYGVSFPTDVEYFQFVDFLTYLSDDILCKVDRASMAGALEVRVPLLNHRVVEYAWSVPLRYKLYGNHSKIILGEILSDYLPRELFDRPKQGFNVPLNKWLRGELREWASDSLSVDKIKQEGLFNDVAIQKLWDEHLSKKQNWGQQLWTILMFQQWKSD